MGNVIWNLEEFRNLYQRRFGVGQLSKLNIYLHTLNWKFYATTFHATQAEEISDAIFRLIVIDFGDEKVKNAFTEIVFEVEAMIQVLHSMADILGQIVNLSVLGKEALSDDTIGLLLKVSKEISLRKLAPDVDGALSVLKNRCEFSYLKAFSNTIKHKTLLDFDYTSKFYAHGQGHSQQGLRFKEFTYKGNTYPVTWVSVVKDRYRTTFCDMVFTVGCRINDYLR